MCYILKRVEKGLHSFNYLMFNKDNQLALSLFFIYFRLKEAKEYINESFFDIFKIQNLLKDFVM